MRGPCASGREELAVHFKRPVNTVKTWFRPGLQSLRACLGLRRMAGLECDLDAAERALGTLPWTAESIADARRRREWEMRLAPLADLLAPVSPPHGLLGRIMERIGEEEAEGKLRVENDGELYGQPRTT